MSDLSLSSLNKFLIVGIALAEDALQGYCWVGLGMPEAEVRFCGWAFWTCLLMIMLLLTEKKHGEEAR